jgi:KaiC/GvpD/RAD55 family RecA-like ATPase
MKLFERLLDTDVKADLLTLFHNHGNLQDTPEGLARRVGRSPSEVQRELEDLVELGILRKVEMYSFGVDRDREIQDAISKQLALGEIPDASRAEAGAALQVQRLPTGIPVLDKVLPDGIPSTSATLILSDPGAGEENLLGHFVSQQVKASKAVVYVTLDNFPANIRQVVQTQSETSFDWTSLIFVDCYSKAVGVESEEEHVVDPENLSAISIAISDIMSKNTIALMVIDSFNTLIRKRGVRSAIELLRVLVARARQARCLCFVTMNRKAFHPAIVASAQDIVDGVIELKTEESVEGIARSLRVLKMLGTKHLTTWIPYDISDDAKFTLAAPRRILPPPGGNSNQYPS